MKNPNKYGTVYKLSGNRRNPFIARAYIGKNGVGRPIYETIGYFKSKSEAQKALADYNINPYNVAYTKYTLEDMFNLFKQEQLKYVKAETFRTNYEAPFRKLQVIHNKPFRDLRPLHYQRIIDELSTKHSKTYLSKVKSVLGLIYKYAIMQDIIDKDYSQGIRIIGKASQEQDYMTQIDVAKMIKGLDKIENVDMILLMCLGGFRPSELLGITKFNVDLKNRLIIGAGIKTEAGKRKRVPISDIIYPYIEKRYNEADMYLFTKDNKQMNYEQFVYNYYKPILKELDIKYKSPKSCRHFLATISKEKGVNDKVRKSILGHTKIELTDNVYTHLQDNYNNKEYEKIDNYLKNI